jgi:peptidoglycan hydrolase CwlO-like protein
MKRSIVAALAALVVTACVGIGVFTVGGAALLNKHTRPISSSPAQGNAAAGQTDQVAQLQSLIAQYQDREQQYQQREQELQDQLAQMNAQLQQSQQTVQEAQMLLQALQQRGLINISNDGRIFITQ